MRSRYCAYVENNFNYILDTWHDSTKPASIKLDSLLAIKWFRLSVEDHADDEVTFTAWYKENGKACKLHEQSRFIFENNRWYYLSGTSPAQ